MHLPLKAQRPGGVSPGEKFCGPLLPVSAPALALDVPVDWCKEDDMARLEAVTERRSGEVDVVSAFKKTLCMVDEDGATGSPVRSLLRRSVLRPLSLESRGVSTLYAQPWCPPKSSTGAAFSRDG